MPKLSILLPTFNGEKFLVEQLESILSQTDGDFELLALDDGSTDGTVDILERFAGLDLRLSILPATGNAGQTARLVELLGHARSDYVAIADQDDRWAPDRNARLFAAIGERQIAFGRSDLIDAEGADLGMTILDRMNVDHPPVGRLRGLIQPMYSAHAMIIRRRGFNIGTLYDRLPFDWLLAIEALLGDGIVYCDEAVVQHRQHANNQCNNFQYTSHAPKFGQSELRYILMFRTPAQLQQWSVFDYIGRSRQVGREWRLKFAALARDCETVWFSEWRALRSNHAALRASIIDTLAPLATSEDDRRRFESHIDTVTGGVFSRPVLGEVARRFRLVRSW